MDGLPVGEYQFVVGQLMLRRSYFTANLMSLNCIKIIVDSVPKSNLRDF